MLCWKLLDMHCGNLLWYHCVYNCLRENLLQWRLMRQQQASKLPQLVGMHFHENVVYRMLIDVAVSFHYALECFILLRIYINRLNWNSVNLTQLNLTFHFHTWFTVVRFSIEFIEGFCELTKLGILDKFSEKDISGKSTHES